LNGFNVIDIHDHHSYYKMPSFSIKPVHSIIGRSIVSTNKRLCVIPSIHQAKELFFNLFKFFFGRALL